MLGKKMVSFKNLAKKVKSINTTRGHESQYESLLGEFGDHDHQTWQRSDGAKQSQSQPQSPAGTFAVYVGEERERFIVPTSYLTHPLVKMLLEKSHEEFCCFDQKVRLVVPCSVSTFEEVVIAAECCYGNFDFGEFVEEFI